MRLALYLALVGGSGDDRLLKRNIPRGDCTRVKTELARRTGPR